MHRLFAALPVPDELAERVISIQSNYAGIQWTDRYDLLLQICDFGDVSQEELIEIKQSFSRFEFQDVQISFEGVGVIQKKETLILCVYPKQTDSIEELAKAFAILNPKKHLIEKNEAFAVCIGIASTVIISDVMRWTEQNQKFRVPDVWFSATDALLISRG